MQDPSQEVARDFHAEKTPHAFVMWRVTDQWIIEYKGAIDDNGAETEKITHAYVEEAVDALLANKSVVEPETNNIGCRIQFMK
ncbi:MAG: hypothetical protein ABIQ02_08865 [Saprospiraceae bacterium]